MAGKQTPEDDPRAGGLAKAAQDVLTVAVAAKLIWDAIPLRTMFPVLIVGCILALLVLGSGWRWWWLRYLRTWIAVAGLLIFIYLTWKWKGGMNDVWLFFLFLGLLLLVRFGIGFVRSIAGWFGNWF